MKADQPPRKINLDELPEFIRPYFKAKQEGKLAEYYLVSFRRRRDDYKDDLPQEDVRNLATLDEHGHFVGDNYKCRGNYIFGLSTALHSAINDSVITDPELLRKIGEFRNHDFRFHHNEFTTQEEIDMINEILREVIKYLESKK